MPYSGFFRRAIAFIIDMLIVSLPTFFVFGPLVAFQTANLGGSPENISSVQTSLLGATVFSWQIVSLLVAWLYFAILESGAKQSTWGKRILGIKVVGKEGERIGFGRATARFFSKVLSYLFCYIGFIIAAFTNRKRALHDMIVETCVVKKDFEQGQQLPPTKTHWLSMILVCAAWILFLLLATWMTSYNLLSATQKAADQAAARLNQLAQDGRGLRSPLRETGATYFSSDDGYRAVVLDPASTHKFTLFIQKGATRACCETFPFGDCTTTGFPECQ